MTETSEPDPKSERGSPLYALAFFALSLGALALIARPFPFSESLIGRLALSYAPETWSGGAATPELIAKTAHVVERRLRALGASDADARVEGGLVVATMLGGSTAFYAEAKSALEQRGELAFKLVVDEKILPRAAIDEEIAHVQAEKRKGTYDARVERYDVAEWNDIADATPRRSRAGDLVLLDAHGVSGERIADVYRAPDGLGRVAIGFEFGSDGAKEFYTLTSTNVGRKMAIVYEGRVITAPEIKAAIGARGIIEGGAAGFSDDYVRRVIAAIAGGPLPLRLKLVSELAWPPERGRALAKAAAIGALALGLVVLLLFTPRWRAITIVASKLALLVLLIALLARELSELTAVMPR